MGKRIVTGVILAAVVIGAVLYGPFLLLAGLMALAVLAALHEFLGLPGTLKGSDRVAGLLAGATLLATAALAPEARLGTWIAASAAASAVALLLVVLFSPHPMEQAGARASHLLAGALYVGLLGACAVLVARPEHGDPFAGAAAPAGTAPGRYVLLVAAAVTWLNDTLAFAGGKLAGRHKLYPAVSPNKTWEGSIAGMAGSVLGAFAIKWILWPEADPLPLAGFAIVGGALGQTGDLAESVFKRACAVKDSGALLPGHGGLLDRIDAFLFVAPAAWLWFFVLGWS